MNYRERRPARQILTWVIILGVLAGVFYTWGEDILYFVTGEDILDDLRNDLADWAPAPVAETLHLPNSTPRPDASDSEAVEVSGQVEVGPDGFPLQVRHHVVKYIIQPGDTLFGIADRFGINPNTIFWANTDVLQDNVHLLQLGTPLYILPVDGVYHLADGEQSIAEIASLYGVTAGDILYSEFNTLSEYDSDYVPPADLRIVVPNGRRDYISYQAPIRTGTESGAANPEGSLHPGSCRQVYVGTGGVGDYINPVGQVAYRVTTEFALWHPGTDFAVDYETPIYAAETGVVVFAGWHRDGYGELIIIDHGDGWTTYYAHLSNRFVGCGDQVTKGQLIGEMGMTGNATGIHLHFEIRQNDIAYNVRDFLDLHDARDTNP